MCDKNSFRELWAEIEPLATSDCGELFRYLKKSKLAGIEAKYQTLLSSKRSGCIGFAYRKLFPDVESIIDIFRRKGFQECLCDDKSNHIYSLSYPLDNYWREPSFSPRLHIDFLPLNKYGANVWVIPHIDPHDPERDPLKHRIDVENNFYIPPSPELKNLVKRLVGRKRITRSHISFVNIFLKVW